LSNPRQLQNWVQKMVAEHHLLPESAAAAQPCWPRPSETTPTPWGRLFEQVSQIHPGSAGRLTDLMLELDPGEFRKILGSQEHLRRKIWALHIQEELQGGWAALPPSENFSGSSVQYEGPSEAEENTQAPANAGTRHTIARTFQPNRVIKEAREFRRVGGCLFAKRRAPIPADYLNPTRSRRTSSRERPARRRPASRGELPPPGRFPSFGDTARGNRRGKPAGAESVDPPCSGPVPRRIHRPRERWTYRAPGSESHDGGSLGPQ
jgi:hypothetical protein